MIRLTLTEIAAAVGGERRGGDPVVDVVSTDSRRLEPGALFVALPGEDADGHDHVADAASAGAAAAMVARPVETQLPTVLVEDTWEALGRLGAEARRRVDPLVVAVTGSVGKTTTKDLTAAAVRAGRRTVAAEGSYNNELGVPLTLLAVRADTEVLVTELGSRGLGHIAALTPLVAPEIGIVTRVAGVHLEQFGDLGTVARAKAELVEALPPTGYALLCADDPRVTAMGARTAAEVVRYGVSPPGAGRSTPPDVWAEDVDLDGRATPTFTARTPWGRARVQLPVAGAHQVGNALAAITAAALVGVDPGCAAAALRTARVSAWRGAVVEAGGVVVLNDAYNANPTSVVAALRTLAAVEQPGRRWAVLGVMAELGPDHEREHERVGHRAAELGVDRLLVVGRDAAAIAEGAVGAGLDARHAVVLADAGAAVERLDGEVGSGDAVLVKASRVAGLEVVAEELATRLAEDPA